MQVLCQPAGDLGAAVGGDFFECRIVHFRAVVRFVGDGAEDDEGNAVAVSRLGDGRALHFRTQSLGVCHDFFLHRRVGYELVAAGDPAHPGMAGIYRLRRRIGVAEHRVIGGKRNDIHPRNLAEGIAEMDAVKVMVHGVPAHHQIADVQLGAERTGNTGVHQMGHAEAVAEDLHAQRRVDLAHAALHQNHGKSHQHALMEGAACFLCGGHLLHFGKQCLNLHVHGTNNS